MILDLTPKETAEIIPGRKQGLKIIVDLTPEEKAEVIAVLYAASKIVTENPDAFDSAFNKIVKAYQECKKITPDKSGAKD